MKVFRILSVLLVAALLLSACAQPQQPTAEPEQPVQTEAPQATEEPVQETEAPAPTEEEPAPTEEPAATEEMVETEAPVVEEGPVVVASPNDMITFAPHALTGMFPYRSVAYWVFDALVTSDRQGQPEPELAQSWEQLDPLTWEFKMVEGATFHNGEPVNAEAVKASFDRMALEENISYNQIYRQAGLKEVNVIDEYTVQLVTEAPAPDMLFWVSECLIVPPVYYSENDAAFLAENPVGSGPYKFVEWVKDDHASFVANEDYWQGAPDVKEAGLRIIPEASSRMNELITGNVDLVTGLLPDQADQANSEVSRLVSTPGWRKMHVGMSQDGAEPLRNKLVRQALNYAVDKQTIIDALLLGATTPLQSIVNPPLNNPDLEPYPYDPEKAKELLAEAGYPDGFTVLFQTPIERYGMDKDISQVVAQYLEDVGIDVELEVVEWGAYVDMIDAKSYEGLNWMGWSTYIVLGPQLGTLSCGALDNPTDYCNPEYDALYEQVKTAETEAERQELSYKMQEIIWEDAPWIFLWRLPMYMGLSNRIEWEPHPALYVDMWEISFK